MADSKITALTALTAADPANDMIPIVDVSDTPPASGNTKRISINNLLACSPSATLASATITGDLTVDTSTLKVDSTNNRVGIGTATPGAYALDVKSTTAAAQLRIFGSNQNSITFGNAAGGASNGFLMGRSFSSDDANNLFVYDLANSALRFFIGGTGNVGIGTAGPSEAVDVNSGNLKLTNGNVVLGTSGKGIDFSATTSGSGTMTSELLNDYEEGTFTPIISGATTAGAGTYTTQVGRYTKIGRMVNFQLRVSWTAHTGTGGMIVGGLPFTSSSVANSQSSVAIGFFDNVALTASNVGTAFMQANETSIALYQYPVGGGATSAVGIDSSADIMLSGSYTV